MHFVITSKRVEGGSAFAPGNEARKQGIINKPGLMNILFSTVAMIFTQVMMYTVNHVLSKTLIEKSTIFKFKFCVLSRF